MEKLLEKLFDLDVSGLKPGQILIYDNYIIYDNYKGEWKNIFFDKKEQLKHERKQKLDKLNANKIS